MKFVKAEEIQLPNENRRLIKGYQGRLVANKEYQERQETLAILFKSSFRDLSEHQAEKPIVIMEVHTYKDLDNVIKPVVDVLENLNIIPNDRNNSRIDASKVPIKKGQRESIFIIIR